MDTLSQIIDTLIDDQLGIIRGVEETPRPAGSPAIFYYYAKACDTGAFCSQKNFSNAGGASINRWNAMAKAVGEAIERYCSAIYEAQELPLASFNSASFSCVPPNEFALYSPSQYSQHDFPFLPFAKDTPVRWAPCRELKTGEIIAVPAVMVYLPYSLEPSTGEHPIAQCISTGLACHTTFFEAAISAISEVIERDAFMIAWQAKLSMPKIRLETLSSYNKDVVNRIQRPWRHVTLLNITLDTGVPTVLAVVNNDMPDAPAFVFAAATHPDPEQAARKCLEEVAFTGLLAQQLKSDWAPISSDNNFAQVVGQDCHVRVYGEHSNSHLIEFILKSEEHVNFSSIPSLFTGNPELDLQTLVDAVHSVNHRVFISDVTSPDVAALGLWVLRAVIPGFHPLFIGHHLRALGGSRLWEIPQKLGFQGITRDHGDNPAPHPYP